ncbi:MAG TPA: S41 family peptidase [Chitinophagales bacterium]|nr:S41 family peptidase [Chitinophagales bacterium]
MPLKKHWQWSIALCLTAAIGFSFKDDQFEIIKNLEIFTNIMKELNASYVDPISPSKLIRTGIDGMTGSLDPYTDFIDEENIESYKMTTTGRYGGVGALIKQVGDYVMIDEPYEGFPADKAGLRAGDKILEIDGTSVKKKNTEEVSKLLKGRPNTEVTLLIERLGETKPLTKIVKRQEIHIKSVPYYGLLDNKTGYIRLNSFTENCSKEVGNALKELKDQYHIESLVFDLRGNPGGLLDEAVNTANIFIPQGKEVVSTRGRNNSHSQSYKTTNSPVDTNIPLVVLIDDGSASAAEIVAGTIQDLDRGVIVGRRSFGKGLVQSTRAINYNTKVKLTTAKYYLPSGRCIQEIDYSKGFNPEKMFEEMVGKPDSLHKAFKTSDGRTVYDAGGIRPDFEVDEPIPANVTISLLSKQLVFDYATQYRMKHDQIPPPEQFELSDAEYSDFVNFLAGKENDYTTRSEELLKTLQETAQKEKYDAALSSQINAIKVQMSNDKGNDLDKFKAEIKKWLEYEIVKRYFYQVGEIKESLEDDLVLKKATSILNDKNTYSRSLQK